MQTDGCALQWNKLDWSPAAHLEKAVIWSRGCRGSLRSSFPSQPQKSNFWISPPGSNPAPAVILRSWLYHVMWQAWHVHTHTHTGRGSYRAIIVSVGIIILFLHFIFYKIKGHFSAFNGSVLHFKDVFTSVYSPFLNSIYVPINVGSHIHFFQLRPTPIECWQIENFNDLFEEFCLVNIVIRNVKKSRRLVKKNDCYESICCLRGIKYMRRKRGCASEIWRKATDCHARKLHPADEPPALACSQATWITFNNSLLHFW